MNWLAHDIENHEPTLKPGLIPTHLSPLSNENGFKDAEVIAAAIGPSSRIIMHSDPYSVGADRFRMTSVYLRALNKAGKLRTLMITSAVPGEGKTMTSLNLATCLAERGGSRVVLVEADLRSPSVTSRLGIPTWPGLTRCLTDGTDPVSLVRFIEPLGFYLLPAGEQVSNPIHLLGSERFARTIQRLRAVADWVILDCTPVIPVPDVLAIRTNVDGALWVLRANSTPRDLVKSAMQHVGSEMVVGVLLNDVELPGENFAHYYNNSPTAFLRIGT